MKNILALTLLISLFLVGCNDDEGNEGGNPSDENSEQASAELNSSMSTMSDDIISITQTQGVDAIQSFIDLLGTDDDAFNGRLDQQKWIQRKINQVNQTFITGATQRVLEDDLFVFEDIKGIWEWDALQGEFILTDSTDVDSFIVKFPTEGSNSNNAIFTLSELDLEVFNDGFEDFQLPTSAKANLLVDGNEVMNVDMKATYTSEDDEVLPLTANVSLGLLPYTFQMSFDDSLDTSSSASYSFSDGEGVITSTNVTVSFETASKVLPEIVEGFVTYREITISGNIDINKVDEDGDPNDYVDLEILISQEKVGDIIFILEEVEAGLSEYVAYILYLDGSTEKLEDILQPVIDEIEKSVEDFEG